MDAARIDGRNEPAANAPDVGRERPAQGSLDEGGAAITSQEDLRRWLRARAANRAEPPKPHQVRRSSVRIINRKSPTGDESLRARLS
jgi:hypothetical protein